MPSPQNTIFIESETEPESVTESESIFEPANESITEPESDPDQEYVIENQLGLPDYRYGIIESSPPPVNVNGNFDNLNNEEGEFFLKERCGKTEFWLAKAACGAQVSADDSDDSDRNDPGVGLNTDIVLSLGEVRNISSLGCCDCCLQKIIAEKDENQSPSRRPIPF
jgi:hypothetical protein